MIKEKKEEKPGWNKWLIVSDIYSKNSNFKEGSLFIQLTKMCKGSKKYNKSNKENFLERQKNYNEKKLEKEKKLKEMLQKEKEDEIKKNNILLIKNEEKKENSENNKKETNRTVSDLFEWEEKRKSKNKGKRKN